METKCVLKSDQMSRTVRFRGAVSRIYTMSTSRWYPHDQSLNPVEKFMSTEAKGKVIDLHLVEE
jgi:hypothetical protein